MKRILLSLLLILVLALSACSLTGFTLWQSQDSNETVPNLNDTFDFVNIPTVDDNASENSTVDENITSDDPDAMLLTTIEATEGDLVSLANLLAEDPDGDTVEYTYSEPFNSRGLWQTNDGDKGKYLVDITATDGLLSTTEQIKVVILPSNKGPVIDCPTRFDAVEGDLIDIPCTIYDMEGDSVNYTVSGFLSDLKYQSNFNDEGNHTIVVSATDGSKITVKEILLVIANNNQKPVVTPLADIDVLEGEEVVLAVNATDLDGDYLTIAYPERFGDFGIWKTTIGDAGTYEFEVSVSDGSDSVIVPVNVLVNKINLAPVITPIAKIEVDEGDLIKLPIEVIDNDGDNVVITVSGFMTGATYQTTYDDAGNYSVTITATDAVHTVSMDVPILIVDVNRPPVFIVR